MFKIIDRNRFYLKNTDKRFVHLATVHDNIREFMCFADKLTGKIYIEEATGGHLSFIEDDLLAEELAAFLTEKKVLNIDRPILSDSEWFSPTIV